MTALATSAPANGLCERLAAKLREALLFFNDHPNFSLRHDRRRTSYQLAAEIEALLPDARTAAAASEARHEVPSPAGPVKFRNSETFTRVQVEAALCAWEWMLENQNLNTDCTAMWEDYGASAMRHCSMQAGDIAERTFKHMEAQGYAFNDSYDWTFVPAVLMLVDWRALVLGHQCIGAPYDPDVSAIFLSLLAADKAQREPRARHFVRTAAA